MVLELPGPSPDLRERIGRRMSWPDWRIIVDRVTAVAVPVIFGLALIPQVRWFAEHPETLFGDARLYFRATQAWLTNGDPWSAQDSVGVLFAAPPPALLLNLPLQPLGEDGAVAFWVVAGLLGMAMAIRYYRLPWWWMAFPPFVEGMLPASPDSALLGAMVLGGGALAAAIKWYSVPAMIGEGRWRAALGGALLILISFPFLPWGDYLSRLSHIRETYDQQTPDPLPLIVWLLLLVAILSLGRKGLLLATPAIWPTPQPHYAIFSLAAIRKSRLLAIGFALPGAVPITIILYAILTAARRLAPRLS